MKTKLSTLFSNKDLTPSEKLTLYGIDETKIILKNGIVSININRITECTSLNNRTIRRNLKSFEQKNILFSAIPNEEGKIRHLNIQPKYLILMGDGEVLDKLSSKDDEVKGRGVNSKQNEIRISENEICRNSNLMNEIRKSVIEELDWVKIVVNMNDIDYRDEAVIVDENNCTKHVIKSML